MLNNTSIDRYGKLRLHLLVSQESNRGRKVVHHLQNKLYNNVIRQFGKHGVIAKKKLRSPDCRLTSNNVNKNVYI